jgi:uncharacterized membrane protein
VRAGAIDSSANPPPGPVGKEGIAAGLPASRLRRARAFVRGRLELDKSVVLIVALISAYAVVMSFVSVMRLHTFQTHAFDLGIFNQAFTTALGGRLFYETPDIHLVPSGSFLGTHFSLLLFLLLPVYALQPRPETLLVVQSVFIGLGALPVFLISRHFLGRGGPTILLSILYLVSPAMLSLNLYDFHLEAFLPFFLGMFYFSYLTNRWKSFALFLLLSVITIDFASILVGSIALAHLIRNASFQPRNEQGRLVLRVQLNLPRKRFLALLAILLLSAVSLFAILSATSYFSGANRPVPTTLQSFLQFGYPPESWEFRAAFWFLLLGSLLFLPFLVFRECIICLPWFALTLLPVPSTWYQFGWQYSGAFVAPYLMFATIRGVHRIQDRRNIRALLMGSILVSAFLTPLNPLMQGTIPGIAYQQGIPIPNAHHALLHEVIALIPPTASVLTQNSLFPQVSGRPDAFLYRPTGDESVDYVLADTTIDDYSLKVWGLTPLSTEVPLLMSTGEYGMIALSDGILLLGRGYTGPLLIAGPTHYRYDHRDLSRVSGTAISDPTSQSGIVFFYSTTGPNATGFWGGPYVNLLPGRYEAAFHLKVGQTFAGDLSVSVAQTIDGSVSNTIASRMLDRSSFSGVDVWEKFVVPFTLSHSEAATGTIEFRSSGLIEGPLSFDYVLVTYVGSL